MHALKHPYPSVLREQTVSYGGNQNWSARRDLRLCGCGAVAMTDLVCYLTRYHGCQGPEIGQTDPIPLDVYDRLCSSLQRKYLPMIPPVGIAGFHLAAGLGLHPQGRVQLRRNVCPPYRRRHRLRYRRAGCGYAAAQGQ